MKYYTACVIDFLLNPDELCRQYNLGNVCIVKVNHLDLIHSSKLDNPSYKEIKSSIKVYLVKVISILLNIPVDNITISKYASGKPYIYNPISNLQFNISHSRNISLIAFNKNNQIGIDIEYTKKNRNFLEIAKLYFSSDEYQSFLALPSNKYRSLFYKLWVMKESYSKAFQIPMSSVLNTDITSINIKKSSQDIAQIPFSFKICTYGDYLISLCNTEDANE